MKEERDNEKVQSLLAKLEETAADEKANIMPLTIEAVKAYATIGEITGTLKKVFGEYSGYGKI